MRAQVREEAKLSEPIVADRKSSSLQDFINNQTSDMQGGEIQIFEPKHKPEPALLEWPLTQTNSTTEVVADDRADDMAEPVVSNE